MRTVGYLLGGVAQYVERRRLNRWSMVRFHPPPLMNDEKIIRFVYIAGREHAAVSITTEQYEQIKSILYGEER